MIFFGYKGDGCIPAHKTPDLSWIKVMIQIILSEMCCCHKCLTFFWYHLWFYFIYQKDKDKICNISKIIIHLWEMVSQLQNAREPNNVHIF